MKTIDIPIEFLGWDRPLLHATVDYLIEHFTRDGRLDLRRVVLTLPGRRAINRLEEMLAEQVETLADLGQLDPAWYPPEFLTLGTLPERFYEQNKPLADDLTQRFAWIQVFDSLEDENPDLLARFLPHPPKRSDWEARLTLGKIFANLHRELAADAINFSDVTKICRKLRIEKEADRWAALETAQQKYLALIDSLDIWDLQTARLFAINNQKAEEYDRIVQTLKENDTQFILVGLVDMNQAQKKILEKFSRFVTPLVFAPESLRDRFDSFGCLKPDAWAEAEIAIDSNQVCVEEKPSDQADAVLRKIAALQGRFAASEIVIGVPDTRVIPYIEQRLDQAEIETRHFQGTPMTQTGVYRFCEAVLGFLEAPTFHAFAEIMRHPDVERYLSKDIEQGALLTNGGPQIE